MEAILRVSRSRQHALTTALRVDMAYLCVGERTVGPDPRKVDTVG